MVFSEPASWEGDKNVRQVLIFSTQNVRDMFEKLIADPLCPKTISGHPDENGQGAIYKLRALKTSTGKWKAVVRCGFTGDLLNEEGEEDSWQAALVLAAEIINDKLKDSAEALQNRMQSLHSLKTGVLTDADRAEKIEVDAYIQSISKKHQ